MWRLATRSSASQSHRPAHALSAAHRGAAWFYKGGMSSPPSQVRHTSQRLLSSPRHGLFPQHNRSCVWIGSSRVSSPSDPTSPERASHSCWRRSSRRQDYLLTHKLDPLGQKLLTPPLTLECMFPTVPVRGGPGPCFEAIWTAHVTDPAKASL